MYEPERHGGTIVTPSGVIGLLTRLHRQIRAGVQRRMAVAGFDQLSEHTPGEGDVRFDIDLPAEEVILKFFSETSSLHPALVVSEGLGTRVFPDDVSPTETAWQFLIDPLDGSRELMYDKRSAWILTGASRTGGSHPGLETIEVAVQTEVPVAAQRTAVTAYAVRGQGAYEQRWSLDSGTPIGEPGRLQSSAAQSIRGGYAVFVHYFPGIHETVGRLADDVFQRVLGPPSVDGAEAFDDQYVSTGGQVYLLASARYRFVADLRPELSPLAARGGHHVLCAHPYDLATALIAGEAGAIVTDGTGRDLTFPFDTSTPCSWIGYANPHIKTEIESVLQGALRVMTMNP